MNLRWSRRALLLALILLLGAAALVLVELALRAPRAVAPLATLSALLVGTSAVVALASGAGLARELQRRRETEEQLRASQAKFGGILSIAADAIITVDEQRRILHFNRGAEQIFDVAAEEVLGQSLNLLIPGRFHAAHDGHIATFAVGPDVARRMGERRRIFGRRRDGREFPAEASISRLVVGGAKVFTVVLRDISDRMRSEEHQRFLARASAHLATSLDYESTLRSVAHLAVPYLADCCVLDIREGDEFRRVASVHEDPDHTRRLRLLERRAKRASNWPLPLADVLESNAAVLRRDVPPGWATGGAGDPALGSALEALGVRAFMMVPLSTHGRVTGALTLLSTTPDRECGDDECGLAEELAQRAAFAIDNAGLYRTANAALQARDDIIAVVSHDLRNPLSAIAMCARVLCDSPPAREEDRRDVAGAILESTGMMQRLIQDLLDLSTIESGHLKVYPASEQLPPLVGRALAMVRDAARSRGVTLHVDLPPDLPCVAVDAVRVEQVLGNLLANSVKFTERGGRITVDAVVEGTPRFVRVDVRDTGVGIRPEDLPHIFDRYWHARRNALTEGTGLGLAIARGIVEAHGGEIRAENSAAAGSVFSFTLPVDEELPRSFPAAADLSHPQPQGA
jgi:PAS domain S-box-containing protein